MELSSVVSQNGVFEADARSRITTLMNLINNLTEQIDNLQQMINQQSNESEQMKIAQVQQLGNLQLEILKLQLEKQNMEMFINQLRNVQ